MKIHFVADVSIQDVIGGAERVLFEQTTRLAAKGHEVHINFYLVVPSLSNCIQEWGAPTKNIYFIKVSIKLTAS